MKAIKLPPLDDEQLKELNGLYRTTRDVRLQRRAQMILLAAEKGMVAQEIAEIVRDSDHYPQTPHYQITWRRSSAVTDAGRGW